MAEKDSSIIEKIYIELLGIRQDISDIKQAHEKIQYDINGMRQEFMRVKLGTSEVRQEIISAKQAIRQIGNEIDSDIVPKVEAQIDEYKQNAEQIEMIEDKIMNITNKLVQLK